MAYHARSGTQSVYLPAATLVAERPRAKVFAVIRQYAIAAFTQPRARPLHHRARIETVPVASDSDAVAMSEALERNILHRSAPPSVREAGVVNDTPVANVDAVMRVERARCDEMGCEWGLLAGP
jgi:hypothetical protein